MDNPAQILLVEDNHMDIVLTLDAFKEAKLKNTINVARDGGEALDYLFVKLIRCGSGQGNGCNGRNDAAMGHWRKPKHTANWEA